MSAARIRQGHRWFGLGFVLTVLAYVVAMLAGPVPGWLTYLPLAPLVVLAVSGSVLFVQPYLARRRPR
jgi:hypothetical protein